MCNFSKSNLAIPTQFFAHAQTFDRSVYLRCLSTVSEQDVPTNHKMATSYETTMFLGAEDIEYGEFDRLI